ncbi:hypothetical protein NNJEOMEG_03246 [Fundidesulfovibrio magnetotacticus]|uniref:Uncharacterized protein n=1 Tax=Fundidesulfovibrio magnetotacticus TaxID=2730080 RepID=A0A6V8LSD5_9BACT|nr:hypothetical protein [Fundidesulfovibrio magnetotacticus]GFK95383.1 hypothetical protein NNJEOMEG_03246 [Fundidesulfovibrio magnetotacticus]
MLLSRDQESLSGPAVESQPPFQVETLLEKGSGVRNEDVLLREGRLLGVSDGATSLVKESLPEGLSGRWLITCRIFMRHPSGG